MARRRRLSLDFMMPRSSLASSDISSSEAALISKYTLLNEVINVECECCGLAEDCTRSYEKQVRGRLCGHWLCGLCSEAVKVEIERLGLNRPRVGNVNVKEEAIVAHMEVCKKFNKTVRMNPAMSLACAMGEILKKSNSKRANCTTDSVCS